MSHRDFVKGPRHVLIHMLPWLIAGLVVMLAVTILVAVSVGTVHIPIDLVWRIIASHLGIGGIEKSWSVGRDTIIWEVRLPRALLGALVGASLAMVGAALQSVTRNTLADPHLLGISSGAALGAIVALLHTGMFLGLITVPLFAFAGALISMVLVVAVAQFTRSTDASRLVLTGLAVSFVLSSLGSLAIFLGDPRATQTVVFWMLGGLGLAQWQQLPYPLAVFVLCSVYLIGNGGKFNAMTLGDETATTLGIPAGRFRMVVFVICALLTGAAVAFAGIVSFVGLMVPHIVRYGVGGDYRRVLPLSAVVGAIFLVLADLVARVVISPQDMPLGVITGLAGGVFFIGLMHSRRRL
ncbi:iron ABC transporter permease [Allorhizobium sp. BGMRC 0089]|uniref:FecCD family ABC transporter permease n=1 Tax=Allorhizobium sonneratiae TaxID=2934936 RepID=UPI002033C34F|nr:iron ABC transporter permease [Allorhizobium sonneratiae]MCM2294570.1 iron ABC transporter permease [Allorhizobium sonneratiae]